MRPELAVIWHEYARRLNRGDEPKSLHITDLGIKQQHAIADLLGLDKLPGKKLHLQVARLQHACRFSSVAQLRCVTEQVAGPIVNRKILRQHEHKIKSELWQWLAAELIELPYAVTETVEPWIAEQKSKGVSYDRLHEYRARYQRVLAVLHKLPSNGVNLAVFAADVLGDPHALDTTTSLGRLSIDAFCALNQLPRQQKSYRLRRQWEWAGVSLDGVSSTVLVLGLQHSEDPALSGWLKYAAQQHEPVVLTYRQICRWPIKPLASTHKALIVENPSLIEAAAEAGIDSVPMICSAGQPTLAVQNLVRQLRLAGAEVLQHADFDPAGLHITRWFQQHTGTTPWKMTAQDYQNAVRSIESPTLALQDFAIPDTPWDDQLKPAMLNTRVHISEEQVRMNIFNELQNLT